jgi:hypothetical protein
MTISTVPRQYQIFNAEEYANLPDDGTPWIVRDLLPAGGSMLISGPPKARKTLAAQQLAYAIAMPETDNWLTFPVERHGPVLYLQLDTARTIWQERVRLYREVNKYTTKEVHIGDKQSTPFPFEILNPEHYSWLKGVCTTLQPLVVFIDVLRKATLASEDKSEDMIRVCNALESAVAPAALVILNHTRKPPSQKGENTHDSGGGIGQDSRGSGALPGNVDGIVRITKRTFSFLGRTLDDGRLRISWDDKTFLFSVDNTEFNVHLDAILADDTIKSVNAKAIALAERSKRTLAACRSALRRKMGTLK